MLKTMTLAAAWLALALIAAVATRTHAAADEGSQAGAARVEYRQCPKDVTMKGLRCARVRVPLERADPSLGTIPIAFAVRPPSFHKKPPRGTIFAVEGGPGYGSIGSVRYYANLLGPRLRHRYRLVTVDMRGTGHSQAIDCPALQHARVTDGRGVARCARRLGDTYGSYRTSAAADDLDAVRAALGVRRITMYGDSYGTYLAQSYAYRHGEHLKALILDSAYPVRGESPWYPSLTRHGVKSLSTVCRRTPQCRPGARRRLARVVRRLRRSGRGAGPLIDAIGSAGYTPAPPGYRRINRAVLAFLHGDRKPYNELTGGGPPVYGSPRVYSRGQELAVSCNDYPMLWNKRAKPGARRAAAASGDPSQEPARLRAVHAVRGRAAVLLELSRVPALAAPVEALRAAGPARREGARRADDRHGRRARQRDERGRGGEGPVGLPRRAARHRPKRRARAVPLPGPLSRCRAARPQVHRPLGALRERRPSRAPALPSFPG